MFLFLVVSTFLKQDTSRLGSGLLTMTKGCPGSPEYWLEAEQSPFQEFVVEINRLTSLINFVKGNAIIDPETKVNMLDENPNKMKIARARFCKLRLGQDGTEDDFDTFVNVCLFSLKSVFAWQTYAYYQTHSKSFSISDEAFAKLVLENHK